MWNPGTTPDNEGYFLVSVLHPVDFPKPKTDVLEYRKGKWIFQGLSGKMQLFQGQVLAWMKWPKPYDPVSLCDPQ